LKAQEKKKIIKKSFFGNGGYKEQNRTKAQCYAVNAMSKLQQKNSVYIPQHKDHNK